MSQSPLPEPDPPVLSTAARARATRYQAIFDSAVDFAIIATDREGRVTEWNAGAVHVLGWPRDEIVGRPLDLIFTPEDRSTGRPAFEMGRALQDGRADDERWHLHRDGTRFWASGEMMPLRDSTGEHLGYLKILRDSTQKLAASTTLREAQGLNTLILNSSRDCIVVLDLEGNNLMVSPGAIEAMEISDVDSIIGLSWLRVWKGADHEAARAAVAEARHGGTGRFQGFCPTHKGTPRWWDVVISPLPGADGRPESLVSVGRDITERKQAEMRQGFLLEVSDRLRARDAPRANLASALAHLGQLLGVNRVGYSQVQADDLTVLIDVGYVNGVAPLSGLFPLDSFGPGAIARQRRGASVVCDDVASDADLDPATWAAISTRAYVSVPLVRDGKLRATIFVNQSTPRHWARADVALIEDVASRIWNTLERTRAEAELRLSEDRLRSALAIASLGTFEWNTDTDQVMMSPRAQAIFGLPPAPQYTTDALFSRLHPDDLAAIRNTAATSVDGRVRMELSYRVILPDGAVRHVKSVSEATHSAGGEMLRVGMLEDITERVLAEQALRASESQFRSFAQAMPNHVWTSPANGQLDWFNDQVYAYSGAAKGQLDGQGWVGMLHADDVATAGQRWAAALSSGSTYETEFRLRRADGAYRWHLARAVPIRQPGGALVRWIGTNTDIEDQRAARQALAELNVTLEARVEERTRERDQAWKYSRDLQAVVDPAGIFRAVNDAWTTVLGWRTDEVVGRHHLEMVQPMDHLTSDAALAEATVTVLHAYENRVKHKDGGFRWISWVAAPEGQLIYASGRHITAEKEAAAKLEAAQEQLRQSQKMEAVGQLTGGVAHDFNNLLQVISGNLHLITRLSGGDERIDTRVATAQEAVKRGARLAGQLLAFSRRQALEPKVVNVGRFVMAMDDMLRRALGETIEIDTSVARGLWNTLVDPAQFENAVLNLAINARDAMGGNGKLTIEVGNATLDDTYARTHADVQAGPYVMLAVSDTGAGMTPQVMAQAFEPFFSTKPPGAGTGLGLSMVYGFVKQSGGHVAVYSELGLGTTLKLYLPRAQLPEDGAIVVATGPVVGGTETILVAEDDEGVRTTAVEMLVELGYQVLHAKDAAGALTVVESGVPIDLLFTDVVMPGPLKSTELARLARERQPQIAVLFTSGYTQNAIVHGGRLDAGVELLPKPYSREELARKIRHVLGDRAQRRSTNNA